MILAALSAVALLAAGCGRDDFKNDPRPPTPLEVTVELTDNSVQVAPASFGAGLVNFVIANTSTQDAVFEVKGPTDQRSATIPGRGSTVFKVELRQGTYEASVHDQDLVRPARLEVGPERASAQNDLLLP